MVWLFCCGFCQGSCYRNRAENIWEVGFMLAEVVEDKGAAVYR